MNTLFVAARAIHYASALVLFGELVFAIAVAASGWRSAARRDAADSARVFGVTAWAILAGLVSGAAWFVLEAAAMSGLPLQSALDRDTLGVVLHDTSFGRVWTVRAGLLVALCVIGVAIQRSRSVDRTLALCAFAALVAAAYLGALAWAGHAPRVKGPRKPFRRSPTSRTSLRRAHGWARCRPSSMRSARGGPTTSLRAPRDASRRSGSRASPRSSRAGSSMPGIKSAPFRH